MHNPFGYNDWFTTHGNGATSTGDDIEIGKENWPDKRDSTIIFADTPENAALMGIFSGDTESGMGVYGGGKNPRGIGLGGVCDTGTGVYGISERTGIGVVGRSMAGKGVEVEPIANIVQDHGVGVLGHSNSGTHSIIGRKNMFRVAASSSARCLALRWR